MNLNLQKKCRRCQAFFPAKPMEFKFFCDKKECQEYFNDYHFYTIKSQRYIRMDYFDIYDLDRPRSFPYFLKLFPLLLLSSKHLLFLILILFV